MSFSHGPAQFPSLKYIQAYGGWSWAQSAANLGDADPAHLLIVTDLIVQDDAIGLFRLRPRQRDAPHGGTYLVHDGNCGGSYGERKEQEVQEEWKLTREEKGKNTLVKIKHWDRSGGRRGQWGWGRRMNIT